MKIHIVQLITARPFCPSVFTDHDAAEEYFVQLVQENYGISYPEFCDQEGFDKDLYSSALAFQETLESDELEIQYVTYLLDAIAYQAVQCEGCEAGDTGCQKNARGCPFQELPLEEPDEPAKITFEQYVVSVKKKFDCGEDGSWGEFPFFSKSDWQEEVSAANTRRGYWEHVAANIEQCKEAAETAGYIVSSDPDQEGRFYFMNLEGVGSEISYDSEEEAWCEANSHLDGN